MASGPSSSRDSDSQSQVRHGLRQRFFIYGFDCHHMYYGKCRRPQCWKSYSVDPISDSRLRSQQPYTSRRRHVSVSAAYLLLVEAEDVGERAEDDVTPAGQVLGKLAELERLVVGVDDRRQVMHVLTLRLPQVLQRVPADQHRLVCKTPSVSD